MDDWQSRSRLLIGSEGMERLSKSNVLVAGLGGVGAYAAEMICRAGIGKMTIADGDIVHPTNRNRQLLGLTVNEGLSKAILMGSRLKEINPQLDLTVIGEFLKDKRMIEILDSGFDYVVDAIDTLSPKVFLIRHSLFRKYPVVSSMGAGGKSDPERIMSADISQTNNCSLARMLRKRLHKLGVREGFTAVYSPEPINKSSVVALEGEPNKASTVGTISYMPAAFGIICASVVIRDLAGIPR